jgi:hypothetical protein
MFLNKEVLVIPMLTQFEQHCNAAGAAAMGATVIKNIKCKNYGTIRHWLDNGQPDRSEIPRP